MLTFLFDNFIKLLNSKKISNNQLKDKFKNLKDEDRIQIKKSEFIIIINDFDIVINQSINAIYTLQDDNRSLKSKSTYNTHNHVENDYKDNRLNYNNEEEERNKNLKGDYSKFITEKDDKPLYTNVDIQNKSKIDSIIDAKIDELNKKYYNDENFNSKLKDVKDSKEVKEGKVNKEMSEVNIYQNKQNMYSKSEFDLEYMKKSIYSKPNIRHNLSDNTIVKDDKNEEAELTKSQLTTINNLLFKDNKESKEILKKDIDNSDNNSKTQIPNNNSQVKEFVSGLKLNYDYNRSSSNVTPSIDTQEMNTYTNKEYTKDTDINKESKKSSSTNTMSSTNYKQNQVNNSSIINIGGTQDILKPGTNVTREKEEEVHRSFVSKYKHLDPDTSLSNTKSSNFGNFNSTSSTNDLRNSTASLNLS